MNFCFNYNEKKIEENLFLKKYRKIDKYKELEINKIIFKNIHSIQDDNLKFTNKIERVNAPRINAIKNCILDLIESPENFNLYFDGGSINYKKDTNDAWKLNRLDKILKLNPLIPNQDILYKYAPTINYQTIYNNHRGERGFQLIFTHNDNIINVYLIDLYHLAIPSKDQDIALEYNNRIKYKKDISDCLFAVEEEISFQ